MRGWTIADWLDAYVRGATPETLLRDLLDTLAAPDPAWISVATRAQLDAQLASLAQRLAAAGGDRRALPLYGVPFAAKDNIDAAGFATTAACPAFAYTPAHDATVVARLVQAGAIVIGKTNLDQFATGLVGVRSPYGVTVNAFDPDYISGGSSAGSASVVARGIVPFALGTDTAGSGRVPAGLNNIVGLKPTRGALSNTGVVPACRTLDCVSVFATTTEDALRVYDVAAALDLADGLSRAAPPAAAAWRMPDAPRFAIPAAPEFFGDTAAERAFAAAVAQLEAQGATCVPIDFSPFDRVTALLYDGPWVAERYAAIREFAAAHEADIHPVVRDVIFRAREFSAADAFGGLYRLADLKREADALLAPFDALVVPTAPTHYRVDALLADPIRLNSNLGKYTNFVNLLDWSAVAVPASLRDDGLPFGITLIGDAWRERALATFAGAWHRTTELPRGATGAPLPAATPGDDAGLPRDPAPGTIRVAVVGAHLRGMPLNHELTSRRARFAEATTTSADYRLYALANTTPPKPGLARGPGGAPIKVELWDVPSGEFGSFVAGIPSPLGIGTLTLADGRQVKGFICEPHALADAQDITAFGGWANYLASR
ncbi:allophanate hydrolase [Burkholderia sp. MSh2]|uniref:Amidase n=1 Tax=Burkholderia paludis TaxID=1506587 RepID=A0A6J5DWU2_9BURK|nr:MULTISPECIES: allophanate hydrolase [Burkholderia]KEZ06094.1 allophanate hydrolase [Burkholderia sp. MSh2]CAB3758117.1 Allophanate hydrolase [Burkholderia paludis]VWB99793.1 amidase [Burkholderia paludis]